MTDYLLYVAAIVCFLIAATPLAPAKVRLDLVAFALLTATFIN